MRQVLIWSLAFFVTWVAIVALALVVLRWRLHRMNRVSPAMRSPAPIIWLWSPTQPARLHRRLRTATAEIHLAPSRRRPRPPRSRSTTCAASSSTRPWSSTTTSSRRRTTRKSQRRSLLRQLQGQVADIERLSVRLARMQPRAG